MRFTIITAPRRAPEHRRPVSDPRPWQAIARARISRRRALGAALAGGGAVAALALAGCDDDGSPLGAALERASPTAAAPRRGGTLRFGTTVPIASGLDPQIETGTGLTIIPRLYGYTHHVHPDDDRLVLDHAASVEQPDATTIIITLRGDARFADVPPVAGRAVSAEDVVTSIERYRHNPLVLDKLWHEAVLGSVEALDAHTVRLSTLRPFVYSLAELGAVGAGAIIPREMIDTDLSRIAAGSGPFLLDSFAPDHVRTRRNAGYFGAPLPYLDAMEWRVFDGHNAKAAALEAGDVDIAAHRDSVEADRFGDRDGFQVALDPGLSWLALGLRIDRPPFQDPHVRTALDLLLDRDALIGDLTHGHGIPVGPVNAHMARGFWALPENEVIAAQRGDESPDRRRARAQELLARAGFDTPFRIQTPDTPEMLDAAAAIREQFRHAGLDVQLEPLDALAWFVSFRRGKFEATLINHRPYEHPDWPTRLYHSVGPDATGSPFGFADDAIDRLIERSWGEFDREERRETLLDAQRRILGALPALQLFAGMGWTTARSHVRDWRADTPGSFAHYVHSQWLDSDEGVSN
jgi:peptide/nickel transport system substrate-binding protein